MFKFQGAVAKFTFNALVMLTENVQCQKVLKISSVTNVNDQEHFEKRYK